MDIRNDLAAHVPRLRRYARALLHNRELADDLVQDTLERALARAALFTPGTDLRAWLFTIMHNLFANQARRAHVRGVHVSVDDEYLDEREFAVAASQTRSLEVRDLDAALQRLPDEQRAVVLIVGLGEMSSAEVALTLGVPIGTAMSRLSRGREKLRVLMTGARPIEKLRVVK